MFFEWFFGGWFFVFLEVFLCGSRLGFVLYVLECYRLILVFRLAVFGGLVWVGFGFVFLCLLFDL